MSAPGTREVGANREKADADDLGCFPGSASTLIKIGGCEFENIGYDGTSYLNDWPDSLTASTRPSPLFVTSPLTGSSYSTNYSDVAFNTDLPAIEGQIGQCDTSNGRNCSLTPRTDDGDPAAFYPYYTSGHSDALGGCAWTVGQAIPGFSNQTYNEHAEWGTLLGVTYTTKGGGTVKQYNDYQSILPDNPCPT